MALNGTSDGDDRRMNDKNKRCPNCNRPAIGLEALLVVKRGTLVTESAVKCECGIVWVADRPDDEHGETLAELVERSKEQGKPEWLE